MNGAKDMQIDLRKRLTERPSKELTLTVAREALADTEVLKELLNLLYEGDDPMRWRAAWVLEKVSERKPSLLAKERNSIVAMVTNGNGPDGLRRLLMSILHNLPDDRDIDVELLNYLLATMLDLKATPGVQALAMKLAARISSRHEELHEEFYCIVRNMELEYYSPGVRSAVKQCLKKNKKDWYKRLVYEKEYYRDCRWGNPASGIQDEQAD